MNRIEEKFKTLKKYNQKAFIAFITAGYPDLNTTYQLVLEFTKVGVDIVELGVPFSDPIADGPIIQEASQFALRKKVNLKLILQLVKKLRQKTQIPLCLMTYYNPVFCFGQRRFLKEAKSCGVDGLIIPDLPLEEAEDFILSAHKYNLKVISFVSVTTEFNRLKRILKIAEGFIYYISLTGVTGPRQKLPKELTKHLRLIKRLTKKPVCVGFGISKNKQVRKIYQFADGVIVGSAIIKKIKENLGKSDLVRKTVEFISELKNV